MFWQQKMTTVDPRQKGMVYMMPILFTFLFYRLPSGLVLYWLVNNIMSIGQQWLIHRNDKGGTPKEEEKGGEEPPAPKTLKAPVAAFRRAFRATYSLWDPV